MLIVSNNISFETDNILLLKFCGMHNFCCRNIGGTNLGGGEEDFHGSARRQHCTDDARAAGYKVPRYVPHLI